MCQQWTCSLARTSYRMYCCHSPAPEIHVNPVEEGLPANPDPIDPLRSERTAIVAPKDATVAAPINSPSGRSSSRDAIESAASRIDLGKTLCATSKVPEQHVRRRRRARLCAVDPGSLKASVISTQGIGWVTRTRLDTSLSNQYWRSNPIDCRHHLRCMMTCRRPDPPPDRRG